MIATDNRRPSRSVADHRDNGYSSLGTLAAMKGTLGAHILNVFFQLGNAAADTATVDPSATPTKTPRASHRPTQEPTEVPTEHVPTRREAARRQFGELLDAVTAND